MPAGNGPGDRIRERYELVALRRAAGGQLELATIPLFGPGARSGDHRRFRIRCALSDEHGTVFAVAACERPHGHRLMSVQSGQIPPGSYQPTAELVQPGTVSFRDLPVTLREDRRRWGDIVAQIPDRLERVRPTHLILAIETSGVTDHVGERIDRARQLVRRAVDGANGANGADDQLRVSLLSYGPHAVPDREADAQVRTLAWADTSENALTEIAMLAEQGAAPLGYWRAAQLECLLTELASRVSNADGRPVLVTIGSRPAFPARVDLASEIIPCPRKRNWMTAWQFLRENLGFAFGAITDHGRQDEDIWACLGSTAFAPLSAVDPWRFAAKLGLAAATRQTLPLPLIEPEGA